MKKQILFSLKMLAVAVLLLQSVGVKAINVMDQRWMSIKDGIWVSGLKSDIANRDGDVITVSGNVKYTYNVASAEIALKQQTPEPINFSGWIKRHPGGKADKALVSFDLLLLYTDGTHKWEVFSIIPLEKSGEWIHAQYQCTPAKPLRAIRVLAINNNSDTPMSIKDIEVTPAVTKKSVVAQSIGKLENPLFSYTFAQDKGSMFIQAIQDRKSGQNFIQTENAKGNLWRISLKDKQAKAPLVLHGGGKIKFSVKDQQMTALWEAVPLPDGGTMQVTATAQLPQAQTAAEWNIAIKVNSKNYTLVDVAYPILEGLIVPGEPEKANLLIPQDIGRLIKNPAQNFPGSLVMRYGTNAMTMQFIALYGEKSGLYISCKDGNGYLKELRMNEQFGHRGVFSFEVYTLVPQLEREYKSFFPVELRLFQGDWYTACLIYRDWAMQQKWAECGPMEQRKDFPDPLKKIGISVYGIQNMHYNKQQLENRKKYGTNGLSVIPDDKLFETVGGTILPEKFADHIKSLRDYFEFPLEVFNHPYIDHFGRATPRYMLVHGYPKAARLIRELGCYTSPWTTALRMDVDIERYKKENGEQGAALDVNGKPVVLFCDGCMKALMCPASQYWHDCLVDTTGKLLKSGLTGVYMDEMSSTGTQLCYSKDHGHTVGGGNYGLNGYRKVLESIRKLYRKDFPNYYSSAEQNSEYFIGVHDINYMFLLFHNDLVPAFQAVYHDYSFSYSRLSGKFQDWAEEYAYADPSGKTNVEEVAMLGMRNFSYGIHPGVVRINLPSYSPDAAAIAKHLGRMWLDNQKYVMFGKMLPTPEIISGNGVLTTGLPFRDSTQYEYPTVRTAAWQALDNSLAIVITNAAKTVMAPEIKYNAAAYVSAPYVTLRDRTTGKDIYSGKTSDIKFRMAVEPRTVKVLELIPQNKAPEDFTPQLPEIIYWANHNLLEIAAGNTGKMQIHLENTSKELRKGKLVFKIADNYQITPGKEIAFELPAGNKKVLELNINVPADIKGLQNFSYELQMDDNSVLSEEFNIGVRPFVQQQSVAGKKSFAVKYLDKIPEGRLPESLPAISELKDYKQLDTHTASPTAARFAWNEDALIMEFIVKDKLHKSPVPGVMIWAGDCVQIGLGFPRIENDTNHYYNHHFIYLTMIDNKPFVSCTVASFDQYLKLEATRKDGETYYKLQVPKQLLREIYKGKKFPFSFTVNENDGENFTGWQEWTRGICGGQNFGAWGELVLEK